MFGRKGRPSLPLEQVLEQELGAIYPKREAENEHPQDGRQTETRETKVETDGLQREPAADGKEEQPGERKNNDATPPLRSLREIQQDHFHRNTAAICLSGGGIRSASFALGVVQGLARRGLLKCFQYLSTVSGGGYTGSFLSAWAYRATDRLAEVEQNLAAHSPAPPPRAPLHDPVRWLRRYSDYLTPRHGFFSLDTWTLIATYVRNLMLNWMVLLPFLAAVVSLPIVVHAAAASNLWAGTWIAGIGPTMTILGLLALRFRSYSTAGAGSFLEKIRFDIFVVLVLLVGALVTTFVRPGLGETGVEAAYVFVVGALLGVGLVAVDILVNARRRPWGDRVELVLGFILVFPLSVAAALFWVHLFAGAGIFMHTVWDGAALAILGPPAWILLLAVPEVVFVGVAGRLSDDLDREWWARVMAVLLRSSFVWTVAASLVLLGPPALAKLGTALGGIDNSTWLAIAGTLGAFVARRFFLRATASVNTAETRLSRFQRQAVDLALNLGGVILIAVLIIVFAATIERLDARLQPWVTRELLNEPSPPTAQFLTSLMLAVVLFLFSLFAGSRIHVNRFSLHAMYRDRLVRTFLGASRWLRNMPSSLTHVPVAAQALPLLKRAWRAVASTMSDFWDWLLQRQTAQSLAQDEILQFGDRNPDAFTDLDRHDNPILQWLDPRRRQSDSAPLPSREPYPAPPFHVVNCALNMVNERDISVQERKAESFTFSALHAGSFRTGYREVAGYGGPGGATLGTAMTISGAAVSPNAGYHSTPVTTFLLALFNARLGWWYGNPEYEVPSAASAPKQSLWPLVCELLGDTHSGGDWIYLSDGGHFENLGIYEMVRRGCRYILAVDASADPDRSFEDLNNAIRKARIDLGVEIRLNQPFTVGAPARGVQGRYAALFDISYPWSRDICGQLLYLKTAIYDGNPYAAPIDVMEYAARSPLFPHEPTTDQFFLETQFEAYRALGEHEIECVMIDRIMSRLPTVQGLFTAAVEHIRG